MTDQRAIVSCDIVGHSLEKDPAAQLRQLETINDLVRDLLTRYEHGQVVWASRGDGGHVAINSPEWREIALRLILDLCAWSTASGVAIRVVAHYGDVRLFTGADGRDEFVGEAINLVGRLIEYAGPARVVVSEAFVQALGQQTLAGVHFHDPTTVTPKYFPPQQVYLLSYDERLESAWNPAEDDRRRLKKSQEDGSGWDTVYFAKRLMQINSFDPDAEQALRDLESAGLEFRNHVSGKMEVNPVLGRIESYPRVEFVRAAQLLERDNGDVLCGDSDSGDTMFVLLRGQIQVVPQRGEPSLRTKGDIVGELAFALNRKRTAAMVCIGRTALLGFAYEHLRHTLQRSPDRAAQQGGTRQGAALAHPEVCVHDRQLSCDIGSRKRLARIATTMGIVVLSHVSASELRRWSRFVARRSSVQRRRNLYSGQRSASRAAPTSTGARRGNPSDSLRLLPRPLRQRQHAVSGRVSGNIDPHRGNGLQGFRSSSQGRDRCSEGGVWPAVLLRCLSELHY